MYNTVYHLLLLSKQNCPIPLIWSLKFLVSMVM